MRYLLYSLIAIALTSCGQGFHQRRIQKLQDKISFHTKEFIRKGGKVSTDTLYKSLQVKFPEMNIRFETKLIPSDKDTVYYKSGEAETKIIYKRDSTGKAVAAQPEVKCPERIVYVKEPYEVKTEFNCSNTMPWWKLTLIIIAAFLVGVVTTVILGKVKGFFTAV